MTDSENSSGGNNKRSLLRKIHDWSWAIGICASVAASFGVAWLASSIVLNQEVKTGRYIFDGIGYRYFHATIAIYNVLNNQASNQSQKLVALSSYWAVLEDISKDMRMMRTNPFFEKVWGEKLEDFAIVQNMLAYDVIAKVTQPRPETLGKMCHLFVCTDKWMLKSDGCRDELNIPKAARTICEANGFNCIK